MCARKRSVRVRDNRGRYGVLIMIISKVFFCHYVTASGPGCCELHKPIGDTQHNATHVEKM